MTNETRNQRDEQIQAYAHAISNANNEAAKKELFLTLLTQLFDGKDDFNIIPQFAAGAEKSITNIERSGKASDHGRADTQYANIIIEFEHNLNRTGEHAKEQLAEYLVGNWNSGIKSRFTLIATDCLTWVVYTLDYDSLIGLGKLSADQIKLETVSKFEVNPDNPDAFYFFLDRYLFGVEPVPATLEEIRKRFGHGSPTFQAAIINMHEAYEAIRDTQEMQVAKTNWERFLRIAYGKFDAGDYIFLIHSYLSVLAKMIAYAVISGEPINDSEIREIVNGEAFRRKNVVNFTDNDFFRWTEIENPNLKASFRAIADGLSEIDFSNVNEDILKGVYQELVDDDTRHSLGEHYTPDWLCARIVEKVNPQPRQKILDPSCGSGSFLKAVANHLIRQNPDITSSEMNASLYGTDVHPLSVQITKATLLIAYGKKLASEPLPLRLNVYLANSLLLPVESAALFGSMCNVSVDGHNVEIPASVFNDYNAFSRFVDAVESLAEADFKTKREHDEKAAKKIFVNTLQTQDDATNRAAYQLYKAILEAKKANRNGIWAYILANTYAPVALKKCFDIIIGNPPWLVFRDITAEDYQEEIRKIAQRTGVYPDRDSLITQLELATIFVGHCIDYFLKPNGSLIFVMPRSIFVADQHHRMREGKIKSLEVTELWDLKNVVPLFNVPACVLFGHICNKSNSQQNQIAGLNFSGRLSNRNSTLTQAQAELTESETTYHLAFLQKRTAWSESPIKIQGIPYYKESFFNGATLVPRSLCFVDIDQELSGNLVNRIVRIKTSNDIYRDAKLPWKNIGISGNMHSKYLFRTSLSSNVVPFGLTGSFLVALPIEINENGTINLLSYEDIENKGDLKSSATFAEMSRKWDANKTEKNRNILLPDYLNWQNKLVNQNANHKYIVLYTSSGSKTVSTVIERKSFALPFIVDCITFYMTTNDENEAWYLCAFFNAEVSNRIIKPFQAQGLFGARHIHKKILEIPLPQFDKDNQNHIKVVNLAKTSAQKVNEFLATKELNEHGNNMTSNECGRFRNEVRSVITEELKEIDKIIQKLLNNS